MGLRKLVLDVGKGLNRPTLMELASAVEAVQGVEGVNIRVTDMDIETMGLIMTVEGVNIEFDALVNSIEETGCVIHSVDEVVSGKKMVESSRGNE
ncbi:MAG: DUF211 domain-containing protein [Thermoplasmatales archaeon]|nr:DUF211 domain-containing protein [Thermoplasmatales archaeon]MCW6170730.1 DUF211 domain-containing protein [Thermoplasmatales archaeon]